MFPCQTAGRCGWKLEDCGIFGAMWVKLSSRYSIIRYRSGYVFLGVNDWASRTGPQKAWFLRLLSRRRIWHRRLRITEVKKSDTHRQTLADNLNDIKTSELWRAITPKTRTIYALSSISFKLNFRCRFATSAVRPIPPPKVERLNLSHCMWFKFDFQVRACRWCDYLIQTFYLQLQVLARHMSPNGTYLQMSKRTSCRCKGQSVSKYHGFSLLIIITNSSLSIFMISQ